MAHVFTYGSLMFPEVWTRVVRGNYRSQVVTLPGFSRHALAAREYPGMVQAGVGSEVEGVLWFDVSADDLQRLDDFEGAEYQRIKVSVHTAQGAVLQAGTYLYIAGDLLNDRAWDPQAFVARRFLQAYPPAAALGSP